MKNNPMIGYDKTNKKMINRYCSCIDCKSNVLYYCIKGFITQRPIVMFNINNLFGNPLYNDKNNWKLMIQIKIKHLWIIMKTNNDSSSDTFVDIGTNNGKIWRDAQIMSVWEDSTESERQNKKKMIQKFNTWHGQITARIDINKELKAYVESVNKQNTSKKLMYHQIARDTESISISQNFEGNVNIFYEYFVHLDDISHVRSFKCSKSKSK